MTPTDEPRTNPSLSPLEESKKALLYLVPGVQFEDHDDGTATVYYIDHAVTILSDGSLTGYDDSYDDN